MGRELEAKDNGEGEAAAVPGGTGVAVLGSLVNVVHIIDTKLCRLHLLPAQGQPLPLQRVAPVRGVGVVVDVVLPAADGPVYCPAGGKREVLSRQAGQVPQGLGLDPTYAFPTQIFSFSGGEWDESKKKKNIWERGNV